MFVRRDVNCAPISQGRSRPGQIATHAESPEAADE
jgi:hypothetical protein